MDNKEDELMSTEEARAYLESEGINCDELIKEGLEFIEIVKARIIMKKEIEKKFPLNKVSEELNKDVLSYIEGINIKTEPLWTNTIKNNLMIFYSWLLDKNYMQSQSLSSVERISDSDIYKKAEKYALEKYALEKYVKESERTSVITEYAEYSNREHNFIQGAKWMRDKLQVSDAWVSVEDRLPDIGEKVLVCIRGSEKISIGYRYNGTWYTELNQFAQLVYLWIPLPTPPKNGEK